MNKMDSFYYTVQYLSVVFCTLLLAWYLYYRYCFTYWDKKGLPTKAPSFPGGNITNVLFGKVNLYIELQNIYREFKVKGHKHMGIYFFNGPVYFPIDPTIIKNILTTDFEYFIDRGTYCDEHKAPLSNHLFSMSGKTWKNLRIKLSPTFTSGKLKLMYNDIFMKNTKKLVKVTEGLADGTDQNTKKLLNGFTADIISASAFGIESDTLTKPDSEIAQIVQKIFHPPLWLYFRTILEEGFRNPGKIIKAMHVNKEIENFFTKLTMENVKFREQNEIVRNDFLSLLLGVREKSGLTDNEMIAQSFLFFLAGFETSSSSIAFCLHELAHNPELQDRLRNELFENLGRDYTTYAYDDLLKLPYLDKVVKETLRMYPVVGFLNRICGKDYKVPGTDVVVEKGTPVLISMLGLQRDPDFFPDPMKFDPERFENENDIIPFTNIPFGDGPRICIGMRYGLLQTKIGVAAMISQFKFLPSKKTPKFYELDKISTTLALARKDGMHLKILKVQD